VDFSSLPKSPDDFDRTPEPFRRWPDRDSVEGAALVLLAALAAVVAGSVISFYVALRVVAPSCVLI
jgi:hypothetical protein